MHDRYYKPIYFKAYELVSKNIYKKYGEKSFQFFDPIVLYTLDKIRSSYGPIRVNDWYWVGSLQYRGYRERKFKVGVEESQHRHGRAIDFDFINTTITLKYFRNEIITNPFRDEFVYITAIEDFENMNWVHFDVRNVDKKNNGLLVFGK